jgi:hypothetical protein
MEANRRSLDMTIDACGYEVLIDHCHPDETPIIGCGCDGPPRTVADIAGIGACSLTPGDPSPIGRCPDCDELVYVDTAKTRAADAAPDMLAALIDLADAMREAMSAHIYDADNGEKPEPDCGYTAALAAADAAIAAAKGESI